MTRKTITLGDFLTEEDIRRCINRRKPWITEHIIKPNLERINKALGQKNDPDFMGYLVEHALSQHMSPTHGRN